jgi:hypothetical protein
VQAATVAQGGQRHGGPSKGIDRFFYIFFAKVLNAMKVLLPATRSPRVCHVVSRALQMRYSVAVAVGGSYSFDERICGRCNL